LEKMARTSNEAASVFVCIVLLRSGRKRGGGRFDVDAGLGLKVVGSEAEEVV
jgi:hypothetical protein